MCYMSHRATLAKLRVGQNTVKMLVFFVHFDNAHFNSIGEPPNYVVSGMYIKSLI